MVVSASDGAEESAPLSPNPTLKKRMLDLFSRDESPPQSTDPTKASISMHSSPKPKDRKRALLTVTDITQVFSVSPERPELISRSTLIKVEGLLGDEELAAGMRSREGWLLVMPELDPTSGQTAEMLKWIVG
jgi:CCR4-NOT transcriptional complex subunit CAF120